jgi:hypothetical protein
MRDPPCGLVLGEPNHAVMTRIDCPRSGHARGASISISALTSKIRHATAANVICHCITLFDASGEATLLFGTRIAAIESVDIHSCGLTFKLVYAGSSAVYPA